MTLNTIRWWFACQMPGAAAAWNVILLTRQGGGFYVFPSELESAFKSTPQSNFDAAYQRFLDYADLEVETVNIPPFGDLEVILINGSEVDAVLAAIDSPDYDPTCTIWGFAGTPYPNA